MKRVCHNSEIDLFNVLELKAIKIGVLIYCFNKNFTHRKVMCDNLTVTSCINNTGNIKYGSCKKIACNLWDVCIIEKL